MSTETLTEDRCPECRKPLYIPKCHFCGYIKPADESSISGLLDKAVKNKGKMREGESIFGWAKRIAREHFAD